MVKTGVSRAKKPSAKRAKSQFKKKFYRKNYSKKNTKRYRRMAKKALAHSVLINARYTVNTADNTGALTIPPKESNGHSVIRELLKKSNKYFNMSIAAGFNVPFGSSDAESLGPNIIAAISDKHTSIIRSIEGDAKYKEKAPDIEFHGVKIKYIGKMYSEVKDISGDMFYPTVLFQPYATAPVQHVVFTTGRIYIKFPKVISGAIVKRSWPPHLELFNANAVKIKAYYSFATVEGAGSKIQNNQMKIDYVNP